MLLESLRKMWKLTIWGSIAAFVVSTSIAFVKPLTACQLWGLFLNLEGIILLNVLFALLKADGAVKSPHSRHPAKVVARNYRELLDSGSRSGMMKRE